MEITYDRSVIFFINLVITSHISLELANTAWPKLETCAIWQCFGCQPLGYFHSVVVFLRSEVKRWKGKWSAAITISFEIFRSHNLNWINIIVLRTLRRKNYSCGLLRVIYLSEKTVKQVTWRLCYLPVYLENCVHLPIVNFALSCWLSTWNSWVFGNLYWCYWLAEECSFSLENLNCFLLDLLLKRGKRVTEVGWLSDSLFVLSLCVKFLVQFIFE